MMDSKLLGFLAETFVHPGSGQDAGLIDLPVAREAATDYPVVVGSALKGALRDAIYQRKLESIGADDNASREQAEKQAESYFGKAEEAGAILVSDLRLLLLPVRSLTSSYYWITCPHLIERLGRDERRVLGAAAKPIDSQIFEQLNEYKFLGNEATPDTIYLEEREFSRGGSVPEDLVDLLAKYIPHAATRERLAKQLVVLHDHDFAWFARYGLAVTARNVLDRNTKSSLNLWYEETLPPDSLFYCLLMGRTGGQLQKLLTELAELAYLQVGGNETVGQGWFAIEFLGELIGEASVQ